MLVHILEATGNNPSFLVGGVVKPFNKTARLTDSPYFVLEADEYDTAFFDKRSKFVHYFPNVFLINNLEFDHADIFANLAAIQTQFAHGLRLVPRTGAVIAPEQDPVVAEVLKQGCWAPVIGVHHPQGWTTQSQTGSGEQFGIYFKGELQAEVHWELLGEHNQQNALMAILAAHQVGVSLEAACHALTSFAAPARRLEELGGNAGIRLYDDFAHHPTAIQTTLEGMRAKLGADAHIVAIFEPRSNTMKAGVHQGKLAPAFAQADKVYALQPKDIKWSLGEEAAALKADKWLIADSVAELVAQIKANELKHINAHWVVMSNGGFEQIQQQLLKILE